jgi:REP element-mobilizing transposase RayT
VTAPRQIIPGATYLITRRCSERRFFLRPSSAANAIFAYVLAVASQRYGVLVHAFCVLSNHFHLVVTDPLGQLPDFHRYLDSLVARAMNCALGRWESFWDPDSYSAVQLEGDASVLEKIVYVLANPVAAGLVQRARDWPGLWSDPGRMGGAPVSIPRPREFFRAEGPTPAVAELRLHRPARFENDAAFVESVERALREAEERAAAECARSGRPFLGRARVLAQKPHARPATGEPRRDPSPRVACRSKWKRIESLLRRAEFESAYREALAAWRAGARDAVFPFGTWLMRVRHRARCAAGAAAA